MSVTGTNINRKINHGDQLAVVIVRELALKPDTAQRGPSGAWFDELLATGLLGSHMNDCRCSVQQRNGRMDSSQRHRTGNLKRAAECNRAQQSAMQTDAHHNGFFLSRHRRAT